MNTAISTATITPEVKLFSRFLNIRSKAHHGQALDFVEELMDAAEDDPSLLPILDILAKAVAAYEETHYPMENPSAEKMMAFLMDQHRHNQSEMADIARSLHRRLKNTTPHRYPRPQPKSCAGDLVLRVNRAILVMKRRAYANT